MNTAAIAPPPLRAKDPMSEVEYEATRGEIYILYTDENLSKAQIDTEHG